MSTVTDEEAGCQREFFIDSSALPTELARGKKAVNRHYLPPIPLGFVFQLPAAFTKGCIADRESQAVILDHSCNVQVLYADEVVRLCYFCRHLVDVVLSAALDAPVQPGKFLLCLVLPSTTSLPSSKFPVQPS